MGSASRRRRNFFFQSAEALRRDRDFALQFTRDGERGFGGKLRERVYGDMLFFLFSGCVDFVFEQLRERGDIAHDFFGYRQLQCQNGGDRGGMGSSAAVDCDRYD